MPEDPEQLTRRLRDVVGEDLRSVIRYDWDDYEILYVREDVKNAYEDREIEALYEEFRFESFGKRAAERRYVHGELKSTVRIFENAAEVNLVMGDGEGLAIGLEHPVAFQQPNVIQACIEAAMD